MPQYVDVIGIGQVEFPDGMSKEEMEAALKKLPSSSVAKQQTQQAAEPVSRFKPTPQEIERQTGAALIKPSMAPRKAPTPVAEPPEMTDPEAALFESAAQQRAVEAEQEAKEPPKLSMKQVADNEELFNRVKAYMKASGQEQYVPGEDKEAYVDKFLSQRTFVESGTTFGAIPELSRLVGGNEATRKAIAEGRDLYEKMADRGGIRPVIDVAKGIATDIPAALVTGGAGKVAGAATVGALTKAATQQALARGARFGITAGEAALGGATDIVSQRLEQETAKQFGEEPQELDIARTGAVMLFSGALGYAGARGAVDPAKAVQQGKALEKALADKNIVPATPTAPQTAAEKALVDPVTEQMDKVYNEYVQQTGKQLIDAIDPANELTDAKVKADMSKAAVRLALKVIEVDPAFQLKPNEQVSTAINNVFANIDKIDAVSLERALQDSGINAREFAMMNKVTVSDAARTMQQYSAAARLLKNLTAKDAEFDKKIRQLYEYEDTGVGALSRLNQAQQSLAREWKAWITSGVDTTARNTLSSALVLSMRSGVQFMEGTAFSLGSALSNTAKGNRLNTFYRAMGDNVKDSFDTYFYLAKNNLARDVTDALLKDSPALRNQITQALQETGTREVSAVAKWANSFNVAIDSFVRRAVFTSSVERQLRRQGKDLYKDFLASNTDVPTDILKQATKEALQTTFSYLPSRAGDPLVASTFERGAGTIAAEVISAIDKTPFINFAIPFPRYMANAMGYLYRYSPVGSIGAAEELIKASKLAQAGQVDKAQLLYRQASEKLIQSAVGTAALASAIDYRKENPDVPWYEVKTNEGTSVDVRPLGVPAPYFAVADVFLRVEQGTLKPGDVKAALESITGLKVKAGSQDTYVDKLIRAYESEDAFRAFMIENGKAVGDIAGGFTQPFVTKQIIDFINSVRDEGTVARDPNVIESESTTGAFFEAAVKRVMNRLPVLKEQLPESVMRFNPEEVSREGEFFNRLLGFRQTIERSPEEAEIVRLNLNPYTLYGSSSGNKEYDRKYIETANERVLPMVRTLMADPQYQALPDVEKNIAMSSVVREQAAEARKMTQEFFKANDLQAVYRQRFQKLPTIVKRAIKRRYAEDNDGRDIEEAGDYFAIDKYESELEARTGFAVGGVVSKLFGRAAKKLGSEAAEQTDELLSTPAAKRATTPSEPSPLPTPSPAAEKPSTGVLAPTEDSPGILKGYKPFADEDYVEGWKSLLDQYDEGFIKNWSVSDPEGLADTLHNTIASKKGLKWNEGPASPSKAVGSKAGKTDDVVDEVVDDIPEVEYDDDGFPINDKVFDEMSKGLMKKSKKPMVDETAVEYSPKARMGSLKNIRLVDERDDILAQIKAVRKDSFAKLQKDARAAEIDEDVLAVAQGDYRFMNGVEVDATNKASRDDFFKLAQQKQKQYDAMKEKYKNVPPIKLYHGTMRSDTASTLKKSGFIDPTKASQKHEELDIGAPSFTRDVNLNFSATRFGGQDPEKFVAYEMPYADYVFKRVNMPVNAYNSKDLNVIARTINGAPNTVRPLGLPRAGMYETEEAIVEAEKLSRTKAFKKDIVSDVSEKQARYLQTKSKRDNLTTAINNDREVYASGRMTAVEANKAYNNIKAYLNNLLDMADVTSTKSGMGQQYAARMTMVPLSSEYLTGLAAKLGKDKAQNLADLRRAVRVMKESAGATPKEEVDATNTIRELTRKFNRGGLVSKIR